MAERAENTTSETRYHSLIFKDQNPTRQKLEADVPTIRFHYRTLRLLVFYLPLLIVPWVITCVLLYRPLDRDTYIDQYGFTEGNTRLQRRIINSLAVLNSITSIVTIPIVSGILAHAAVVYTQRRHGKQSVSVRQVFALADRGWSNLSTLRDAWPPWNITPKEQDPEEPRFTGPGSSFLWRSMLFLLICSILQPIKEGLVDIEQILVLSEWEHGPSESSLEIAEGLRRLGFDPEPEDLGYIPEDVVVQELLDKLSSLTMYETPQHLWPDTATETSFAPYAIFGNTINPWSLSTRTVSPSGYFTAVLPNGTTTGARRHRIMRFNSSVECNEINITEYPQTCEGDRPLTADFVRDQLNVRVCVPGARGVSLWTPSRDRQDITEELFVDISEIANASTTVNYTRHCVVQTTRGYFELGNYRNDNRAGPLLNRWIESNVFAEKSEYNDWMSSTWRDGNHRGKSPSGGRGSITLGGRYRRPSTEDLIADIPGAELANSNNRSWPYIPGSDGSNITLTGPLMASALAMFGDRSLYALANSSADPSVALSQICQSGRLPFTGMFEAGKYAFACNDTSAFTEDKLILTVARFMDIFNVTTETENYLAASVFLASQSMLHQTSQKTIAFTGRPIDFAEGQFLSKPSIPLAGVIIISIMVALQAIGLILLAWYIYQVPTWTAALDAMAVARITNSLSSDVIPAVGGKGNKVLRQLGAADGLVGTIVAKHKKDGHQSESLGNHEGAEIGLGAHGSFRRRMPATRIEMQRRSTKQMLARLGLRKW